MIVYPFQQKFMFRTTWSNEMTGRPQHSAGVAAAVEKSTTLFRGDYHHTTMLTIRGGWPKTPIGTPVSVSTLPTKCKRLCSGGNNNNNHKIPLLTRNKVIYPAMPWRRIMIRRRSFYRPTTRPNSQVVPCTEDAFMSACCTCRGGSKRVSCTAYTTTSMTQHT